MLKAPVCPDITQYKKLATGKLSSPDKEALLDHLEGCHACVQRVESLSEKDTLVDLIRQARTLGDGPEGETVARLVEKLRGLRPSAAGAGQAPAQIRLACSSCGKSLKVTAGLAGKKVQCRHCQAVISVPTAPKPMGDESPRSPVPTVAESLTLAHAGSAGARRPARTTSDIGAGQSDPANTDPHLFDFLAPAQSPDELGRLGPYRVLRVLGAGGMGVVFQAEDPHLQRIVALKAMLPGLVASDSAKQRFLREAQAAAGLKHDHIVTIHQVGEDRGAPYLAMEFLEGEALDDRLKREGKLPLADLLRIGREMAEGLAAAHERGLIHRDIKPANVWLEGKKGRVKILDFGLARAATGEAHLTQSGAIVGTPAYMAPEQAQGKNIDPRCDLFSLGCVIYRMATGEAPFRGTDMISTLMAVATENPAPPVSLNFNLPTELSDFIMQLLAKEPKERPESAQAVAESLERMARDGQPPNRGKAGARQEKAIVRPPAASRRGRRIAVAALALALLIPLGYCLSGIILRVESKEGTLVIKTEDPSVSVKVTSEGGTTLTYGKDRREIHLKPGKYGIELADAKNGLKLSTTQLTITSGGNSIVEVIWEKKLDGPGKTAEALPTTFKNTLGMEFVLVPKGEFLMGGGRGMVGPKEVTIAQDFYLGKYEVTQEEWEKLTGLNLSAFKAVAGIPPEEQKRFPVEKVSWQDCQAFIERLNKRVKESGWVYRLPKEAEWEYACRGGPLGDRLDSAFDYYFEKPTNVLLPEQANFWHAKDLKRTCKVGSYQPNRLGLYDMHGNVWEWCEDLNDPKDANGAPRRVFRGGGWNSDSGNCRAADRNASQPFDRGHDLGLRLARVPVGKEIVDSKHAGAVAP